MDCVNLASRGRVLLDGFVNLLPSFSSIVYYRLHLASAIILSSLLYISTKLGYIPTVISMNCDLDTPISSESRARVSKNCWSHLIMNRLSFVITFSFLICTYILFVRTIVITFLYVQFFCTYILFVRTILYVQFVFFVRTNNISIILHLSRGKDGFIVICCTNRLG
jgi:hypothetical protein